jgi:two-component sensor histidine kinase
MGRLAGVGHTIVWTLATDGWLVLSWTETGGPPVAAPTREGFGTRVVGKMVQQAKGKLCFDWRPEGLACEVLIPVKETQ